MTQPATIVIAGDELVAGDGDPRALGWTGRVQARTLPLLPEARFLTLAVPGETSQQLAKRCMPEVQRRLDPERRNFLVLAPGAGDVRSQASLARSRLNLANVLDEALALEISTFVVGPAPVGDDVLNEQIGTLSSGFADVATRRGVPYVDAFRPLQRHEAWLRDVRTGTPGVPGQEGYGLLAWLVLHRGWHSWLGLPEQT